MTVTIFPVYAEEIEVVSRPFLLPPDKSILHRVLFIGSITRSAFRIPIPSEAAISHDIVATVLSLESLGVPIELFPDRIEVQGVGLGGYRMPTHVINCANSGTTARLLMGLLAGQPFNAALTGDESLSIRPMQRLADLLSSMGASIITAPDGTLPLMVNGKQLHGAEIRLPVASAQMKTALILAGLHAEGRSLIEEPWQSRDHTERMLEAFGFGIEVTDEGILLDPGIGPTISDEIEYFVPSDISSAAFLIAAAILLRKQIVIKNVSLNPTRTCFLDVLTLMGVELEAVNVSEQFGESRGDIIVYSANEGLAPFHIAPEDVPLLIDELPILAVLAVFADGESTVRGAQELRHKESDRLSVTTAQLQAFGVQVEELEDGLIIHGIPDRRLTHTTISHGGDHRLAMAFSIAALSCEGPVTIEGAEIVAVSYPEFFIHLAELSGSEHVTTQRQ
ncbi:MAG TPA: 3-phosphoshikimate 1-carboxyvinyltransferase [Candidatus Kapabacteria bacterium]|jgi:3-phosphoshikimate 1-carboxyvinyltransferase|nr:3-phosphoshikimate 1-carboxyvinyltransferase [Candidatus Kapabacteria bacterium]